MSKYEVISGQSTGKYRPEINPYLDTFHAVLNDFKLLQKIQLTIVSQYQYTISN